MPISEEAYNNIPPPETTYLKDLLISAASDKTVPEHEKTAITEFIDGYIETYNETRNTRDQLAKMFQNTTEIFKKMDDANKKEARAEWLKLHRRFVDFDKAERHPTLINFIKKAIAEEKASRLLISVLETYYQNRHEKTFPENPGFLHPWQQADIFMSGLVTPPTSEALKERYKNLRTTRAKFFTSASPEATIFLERYTETEEYSDRDLENAEKNHRLAYEVMGRIQTSKTLHKTIQEYLQEQLRPSRPSSTTSSSSK